MGLNLAFFGGWILFLPVSLVVCLVRRRRPVKAPRRARRTVGWLSLGLGVAGPAFILVMFAVHGPEKGCGLLLSPEEPSGRLCSIRVMNADGTGQTRLTGYLPEAASPAWSPDGREIVYERVGRRGPLLPQPLSGSIPGADIWIVGTDGSGDRALTSHPEHDCEPVWSPDGGRVAFVSYRGRGTSLYVINADGTNEQLVAEQAGYVSGLPAWSPDGRKIIFPADLEGRSEVCIADADGTGYAKLTNRRVHGSQPGVEASGYPSWSPDGRKIAFVKPWAQQAQVWVINADGTGERQLTRDLGRCDSPVWSPDGRHVAFAATGSTSTLGAGILVVSADGGAPVSLSRAAAQNSQSPPFWSRNEQPAWSPDGRQIAFVRSSPTESGVCVMKADGTELSSLTAGPGRDGDPAWSPDGKRIAFVHASSGAAWALATSLVCGLVGPLAICLGTWSLRRERRGVAAIVGIILGVIPTLVLVASVIATLLVVVGFALMGMAGGH